MGWNFPAEPGPAPMTAGRAGPQHEDMTRKLTFRIACGFFGLLCALLTVGSVGTGLTSGGPGGHLHVLLLAHGALCGAFLATGFWLQLSRPATRIAAWQMVLVTVLCMEATGLVLGINDPLFEIGFPVALLVTGLLHPERQQLLRPGRTISPLLAPLALVSLLPAVLFTRQLNEQMAGLTTDRLLAVQAGVDVAVTIPFVALLAALGTIGWRVPARAAGLVAVVFGLGSVAFPDELGSFGSGWGLAAAAAGAIFVVTAEWEARRTTTPVLEQVSVNPGT